MLKVIDGRHPSILSLLDEQCLVPKSSDDKFARSLYKNIKEGDVFSASRLEQSNSHFSVRHYARKVTYDSEGFVETNLDDIGNSLVVINASGMDLLSVDVAKLMTGSQTVIRKSHSASASVSQGRKFSTQLKDLRLRIEATKPSFIRCIKPNDELVADSFNSKNVVEQLRCAGVLSAVEVSRAGFSTRFSHEKFMSRYHMLAPKNSTVIGAMIENVAQLIYEPREGEMSRVDFRKLHKLNPKLQMVGMQQGKTLVFMKRSAFEALEKLRAAVLFESAAAIQSTVRGMIVRVWYKGMMARVITCQSIARVKLARVVANRLRATLVVAKLSQTIVRGFLARCAAKRIREEIRREVAAVKLQSLARMFMAETAFIDAITDIIICQSVCRGYVVRADPEAFKESLIIAQMEIARKELEEKARVAKEAEVEAEKQAIALLEKEKAAEVGSTPLFFAISSSDWSRVTTLIASEPESLNELHPANQQTPLHAICQVEYALNEKVKDIGKDLAARAKLIGTMFEMEPHLLSSKDSAGNTPLHVAAMCQRASPLIQILLQSAPDPAAAANSANNLLQNPIHTAVISGATENLRLLLGEGSRAASLCDINGNNALALAVLHKCEEKLVKTLLDSLDDLEKMLVFEQENGEGKYSLALAVGTLAEKEILELLVGHTHSVIKPKDVFLAIEKGLDIDSLKVLLACVKGLEIRDGYNRNLLHAAIVSKVRSGEEQSDERDLITGYQRRCFRA